MVNKFFDMKTGSGINVNEQLAGELHKPAIKKFKRRKIYARFKDNIWAADLAEMESLFSKSKNVAQVKPLKGQKGKTVRNAFIEIVSESSHKPNNLWVN